MRYVSMFAVLLLGVMLGAASPAGAGQADAARAMHDTVMLLGNGRASATVTTVAARCGTMRTMRAPSYSASRSRNSTSMPYYALPKTDPRRYSPR